MGKPWYVWTRAVLHLDRRVHAPELTHPVTGAQDRAEETSAWVRGRQATLRGRGCHPHLRLRNTKETCYVSLVRIGFAAPVMSRWAYVGFNSLEHWTRGQRGKWPNSHLPSSANRTSASTTLGFKTKEQPDFNILILQSLLSSRMGPWMCSYRAESLAEAARL